MTEKQIEKCVELLRNEKNNNSIYLWGGSGQKVLNLDVNAIVAYEDTPANAGRVLRHIADLISTGKSIKQARAFDCSGLVIEALKTCGFVSHDFDTTAEGLRKMCKSTFPVEKAKKGDLVFKLSNNKAVHVGMCTTNNYVIEARGRDYGVVSRLKNEGAWTIAGRL